MSLHPVGIIAVSTVIWPDRWLRVADIPWLWTTDTQECGWIHSSRPHLDGMQQPRVMSASDEKHRTTDQPTQYSLGC